MLVRKELKLDECCLKFDGDKGRFEGYASRFGGIDSHGDTIIKGAFASTLRANGKPKMFFNHQWDRPIGIWTKAAEDDSGLYVEGEFTPGHPLAAEVHASMKHGALDGLSVGGFVKAGDATDKADGSGQLIHKFTRLVEISPVVFPSDAAARVDLTTVRSEDLNEEIAELGTIREFERFLRDAGSFSRGATSALVARAKVIFAEGEPRTKQADANAQALETRLARLAERTA